jgi:hypothetical protein
VTNSATDPSVNPDKPEDRLARAVRAAEQALIEFEIAVETYRVEVDNFSRLHHQRLGPMYARLDELDALIAEAGPAPRAGGGAPPPPPPPATTSGAPGRRGPW